MDVVLLLSSSTRKTDDLRLNLIHSENKNKNEQERRKDRCVRTSIISWMCNGFIPRHNQRCRSPIVEKNNLRRKNLFDSLPSTWTTVNSVSLRLSYSCESDATLSISHFFSPPPSLSHCWLKHAQTLNMEWHCWLLIIYLFRVFSTADEGRQVKLDGDHSTHESSLTLSVALSLSTFLSHEDSRSLTSLDRIDKRSPFISHH